MCDDVPTVRNRLNDLPGRNSMPSPRSISSISSSSELKPIRYLDTCRFLFRFSLFTATTLLLVSPIPDAAVSRMCSMNDLRLFSSIRLAKSRHVSCKSPSWKAGVSKGDRWQVVSWRLIRILGIEKDEAAEVTGIPALIGVGGIDKFVSPNRWESSSEATSE